MVSLTVANSPVGLAACASTSRTVLAAVDLGTNSCRGPFCALLWIDLRPSRVVD